MQPGAPGQSGKILSPATAGTPLRGPSEADTSFMQGMIMHHSQAVEMVALLRTRGPQQGPPGVGQAHQYLADRRDQIYEEVA